MEEHEKEIKESTQLFDSFNDVIIEWEHILGEGSPKIAHAGLTALFINALEHAQCVHSLMKMISESMGIAVELCSLERKCDDEKKDSIKIEWHIDDVLKLDGSLTKEQAREVLEYVEENHDCTVGVTWDSLENGIEMIKSTEHLG